MSSRCGRGRGSRGRAAPAADAGRRTAGRPRSAPPPGMLSRSRSANAANGWTSVIVPHDRPSSSRRSYRACHKDRQPRRRTAPSGRPTVSLNRCGAEKSISRSARISHSSRDRDSSANTSTCSLIRRSFCRTCHREHPIGDGRLRRFGARGCGSVGSLDQWHLRTDFLRDDRLVSRVLPSPGSQERWWKGLSFPPAVQARREPAGGHQPQRPPVPLDSRRAQGRRAAARRDRARGVDGG